MPDMPSIAISLGHPGGIGPEVIVKALQGLPRDLAQLVIVGSESVLAAAAAQASIQPFWTRLDSDGEWSAGPGVFLLEDANVDADSPEFTSATDNVPAGKASLAWFEKAIRLAK